MRRFIYLLMFMFSLAAPCGVFADITAPRSESDTLRVLAQALLQIEDVERVETNEADRSITYFRQTNGVEVAAGRSFIDNLHPLLLAADTDAQRQVVLDSFIASIADMMKPAITLSPSQVLPVIRNAEFSAGTDATKLVSRPFLADMRVFYVQDLPNRLAYLNETDLAQLGLTPRALHDLAVENAAKMQWHPRIEGQGIYLPILDGTFESSLVLVPSFWGHLDAELGTIGAVVAARDVVIFGDIDTPGTLEEMKNISLKNQPSMVYPISLAPIKWNGRSWEIIR